MKPTLRALLAILLFSTAAGAQVDKAAADGLTTRERVNNAEIDQAAHVPTPDQHPTKFACGNQKKPKTCINSTVMGYGSWTIIQDQLYWDPAGNIPLWDSAVIFSLGVATYLVARTQDIPGNMFSGVFPRMTAGTTVSITVPVGKRIELWFADKSGKPYSRSWDVIQLTTEEAFRTPGRHTAGFAIDWSR